MVGLFWSAFRQAGRGLNSLSQAQARWEIELGRSILRKRKKLLALAVLPVVAAMFWPSPSGQATANWATSTASSQTAASYVESAQGDSLPEKIPILGGSKAFMPAQVTRNMFLGSILVGLIAGLITGVIGAGGGYILTPALMSFGIRGIMCVGTDQFHLFAKAIMGTSIHRKLGNVNWVLAIWFIVGSACGVTAGGYLSRRIFLYSPALSDAVISAVYVVVLGTLGVYAVLDWLLLRRRTAADSTMATTGFARFLQRLPLRPRVRFDEQVVDGGRSICVYPVIACGLIVGFVASIMGVGGGFLTFPMFVYGLGVSTFTTVGTDILQIIFTAGYSSIKEYAPYGFVFYTVAIGMLIGSLVGVQAGALVTSVVKGSQIRVFYALTILAGFFNRLCALPRKFADLGYLSVHRQTTVWIEQTGVWLFFLTVGIFALWIIGSFLKNLRFLRRDRGGAPLAASAGLLVDRGKLGLGLAGLAIFAVALAVALRADSNGRTFLDASDDFFNQLAKDSANYIPSAQAQAAEVADVDIDIGIAPREEVDRQKTMEVIRHGGCEVSESKDGRIRIAGKMGPLCKAALDDARRAFQNDDDGFLAEHGVRAHTVAYCWWTVFDGLTRRYVQEGRGSHAELMRFMATKVMEPAYNFRGIEAASAATNWWPLAGMLGLYVFFTLWYGFSIMLVMEGLGVTMAAVKGRRER
ncbi:MAG: sulfite exporter TauE/SafE family protein [Phycisphaerae bacterium]